MKLLKIARKAVSRTGREEIRDAFIYRTTLKFTKAFSGWIPFAPQTIGIEPTNRCNLSCKICTRNYWEPDIPLGDMSMELFNKIVSCFSKRVTVSPQMFGEPLLAAHFFEMLHIIKTKGSREVIIDTNGTLLTPENCNKLVKEGLDLLAISIDGIDNLKPMRGIDIGALTRNIKTLNRVKKERQSSRPRLVIAFVSMKSNVHELPEMVEFAKENGISGIFVEHLVVHSKDLLDETLFKHRELAGHYFKLAQEKALDLGIGISLPSLDEEQNFCIYPFNSLWVAWDGDVYPCCIGPGREKGSIVLGNLNTSSIKSLWNSQQMRDLRLGLLGYRPLNKYCKNCPKFSNKAENFIKLLD